VIADNWLDDTAGNPCNFINLDGDEIVNFADYTAFANVWKTEYEE
jgi:hypothetical protein